MSLFNKPNFIQLWTSDFLPLLRYFYDDTHFSHSGKELFLPSNSISIFKDAKMEFGIDVVDIDKLNLTTLWGSYWQICLQHFLLGITMDKKFQQKCKEEEL